MTTIANYHSILPYVYIVSIDDDHYYITILPFCDSNDLFLFDHNGFLWKKGNPS